MRGIKVVLLFLLLGEPDAKCGTAEYCGDDKTCMNPAEKCFCFD